MIMSNAFYKPTELIDAGQDFVFVQLQNLLFVKQRGRHDLPFFTKWVGRGAGVHLNKKKSFNISMYFVTKKDKSLNEKPQFIVKTIKK